MKVRRKRTFYYFSTEWSGWLILIEEEGTCEECCINITNMKIMYI